jgi:hypothetical protein
VRLSAFLLFFCVACSAGGADAGESEDDIAKRSHHYVDVSADAPMTGVPREKILGALVRLDRVARDAKDPVRRDLAQETLARIENGDVLIGSIEASRGIDRWHMCKDEGMHACDGRPPANDDRTWRGDAALARKLEKDLAGYQWGNRIYFTLSSATDVNELAATLVHETNHVLNRSECSYYRVIDDHVVEPDLAWIEELRAFFSECVLTEESLDVPKCSAYAAGRVAEYDFATKAKRDPKELGEAFASSTRFGKLVPRKKDWPARFDGCVSR